MRKDPLHETFKFLLERNRFSDYKEEEGDGYRQICFQSDRVVLKIAEQREIIDRGAPTTCIAFLVDPQNSCRWCMLEKAIQIMNGRKVDGSRSLEELYVNLFSNIDMIIEKINGGVAPPYEDFSKYK